MSLLCVRIVVPKIFRIPRCRSITCGCWTTCMAAHCNLDHKDQPSQARQRCCGQESCLLCANKKNVIRAKIQARIIYQQCHGLRVHPIGRGIFAGSSKCGLHHDRPRPPQTPTNAHDTVDWRATGTSIPRLAGDARKECLPQQTRRRSACAMS